MGYFPAPYLDAKIKHNDEYITFKITSGIFKKEKMAL